MATAHILKNKGNTENVNQIQAATAAQKDQIAAASFAEIEQLWNALESNHDITYSVSEEIELETDTDEIDADWETDSEVSLEDEDALNADDGDDSDKMPICIEVALDGGAEAHCTVPGFDGFLSARPLTKLGQLCLDELSSRQNTLSEIAKWLEKNRQAFLKSRNIADLGENAWNEISSNHYPIFKTKKEKCDALADILKCKPATFDKHLQQVFLKWDGILTSIDILFSEEAKTAWAVAAYRQIPPAHASKKNTLLSSISKYTGVPEETIKSQTPRQ